MPPPNNPMHLKCVDCGRPVPAEQVRWVVKALTDMIRDWTGPHCGCRPLFGPSMTEAEAYRIAGECLHPLSDQEPMGVRMQRVADRIVAALLGAKKPPPREKEARHE